jgi:hypothetical protein
MDDNYINMIPDDVLINIATQHWDKLEQFCILLTLDLQKGVKN